MTPALLAVPQESDSTNKAMQEEELKQVELREAELLQKKEMENEKHFFKLADYFVTVGIDDYHQPEEVFEKAKGQLEEEKSTLGKTRIPIDLKFTDDDEEDFDRVVQKLEIFVIKDNSIFETGHIVNGVNVSVTHPDNIKLPNEKWIDLRGDKYIYLKITYENVNNCKRPITDINFYKISRFKQQPNKMCIQVKQGIEPLPVKEFGDVDADQKFKKTKRLGKQTGEDMYNFYGDYDLTGYFEDTTNIDPATQKKNLCLCISTQKTMQVNDIILIIGQQIDATTGKIIESNEQSPNMTMNWEVPEGYKKLAYSIGQNGFLNRLLCLKTRDVMKKKIKAKIIDRYPPEGQDRHYYPFPASISDFCFPSGISLKTTYG